MATSSVAEKFAAAFIGGNAMFYAMLIANRWLVRRVELKSVLIEIVREFGWVEFFDTFVFRPALIVVCYLWLGTEKQGYVWGNWIADGIFYALGFSPAGLKVTVLAGSLSAKTFLLVARLRA
jgi:hypothetical protein